MLTTSMKKIPFFPYTNEEHITNLINRNGTVTSYNVFILFAVFHARYSGKIHQKLAAVKLTAVNTVGVGIHPLHFSLEFHTCDPYSSGVNPNTQQSSVDNNCNVF